MNMMPIRNSVRESVTLLSRHVGSGGIKESTQFAIFRPLKALACRPNAQNVRVKTYLERGLMEGWGGVRVVSSLIWMAIEHPEVMVWLLVPVRAHWNAYGVDPPCSYMGALPTPY